MKRESTLPLTPRLEVRNISKAYANVHALADVTLEVRPGEVMALLGQNGAGKSTLVRILSGLERPDAGEIRIDGTPRALGSPARSQAAGIAVVQQEMSAARNMTIAENLVLGDDHFSGLWLKKKLRKHAGSLLARVGLGHLDPMSPMEDLTIGEMQLVEIARVLSRDAKLIIFDEPTAALSDAEIRRILELIRSLAAEGRSIIYVTHRLKEVFELADRVTVFRGGRRTETRGVEDFSVEQIVTSMVGHVVEQLFPPAGTLGGMVLSASGFMTPGLREPLSLRVRSGEILGLTGQIGSGHSAVLEGLAGFRPTKYDELTLAGTPLEISTRRAGLARGVAYCSEDRKRDGMFPELSVIENLSSPWVTSLSRRGTLSRHRESAGAVRLVNSFSIDPARARCRVGTLSGGNQQKVAIAKWLGTDVRVLMLNEPTRGVDVGARAEIYAKLRALCDDGLSVIIASSDVDEVLGLCDSVTTFYRGRVTAARPRNEWSESTLLREVMHEPVGVAS